MREHNDTQNEETKSGSLFGSRAGLVFLGFLGIGGVLMFTEHRAHVLGALYWLLPFACFFMHMFMHGHHDGHGHRHEEKKETRR